MAYETNALERIQTADKKPRGRPLGSQSRRADIYAQALMREEGDPLHKAVRIANVDVLIENNVIRLAKQWDCDRLDAVKVVVTAQANVMKYLHQAMPQAIIVKPGAPEGDALMVDVSATQDVDLETAAALTHNDKSLK
jgi:hypothetical protein